MSSPQNPGSTCIRCQRRSRLQGNPVLLSNRHLALSERGILKTRPFAAAELVAMEIICMDEQFLAQRVPLLPHLHLKVPPRSRCRCFRSAVQRAARETDTELASRHVFKRVSIALVWRQMDTNVALPFSARQPRAVRFFIIVCLLQVAARSLQRPRPRQPAAPEPTEMKVADGNTDAKRLC